MKYPDDIDFYYVLENHGWNRCYINIEGSIYEMGPTHVFGNPIDALLDAFICVLNGDDLVTFKWQDEPGEYEWIIERNKEQKHKLRVSISNCFQINANELSPKPETIEFEVKQKLFCICILRQMEKIQDLMAEASFREHRKGEFPQKTFKDFRLVYQRVYS